MVLLTLWSVYIVVTTLSSYEVSLNYCSIINLCWSLIVNDEYDVSTRHIRTGVVHVLVSRVLPQILMGTRPVDDRSKRHTHYRQLSAKVS